jgi:hypothetical protein
MLSPLKNLYRTAGFGISVLIMVSLLYLLIRRRSLETLGVLYFSAAYYLIISCTEAAGYIRHAQPFYIAPVFFILILASDILYKLQNRLAAASFQALLTGLLIFSAVFADDPFERKTANNYFENVFPYSEVMSYLKQKGQALRVYAPMEVEPSHFYLAKYGLTKRLSWDRTMPEEYSKEALLEKFKAGNYDYLLLQASPFEGQGTDTTRVKVAEETAASVAVQKEKEFSYKGNKFILLKAGN